MTRLKLEKITSGEKLNTAQININGQSAAAVFNTPHHANVSGTDVYDMTHSSFNQDNRWDVSTFTSNERWAGICYGNGIFVAVPYDTSNTCSIVSTDGVNWTESPDSYEGEWLSVCYGNGLFVAVNSSNLPGEQIMTSVDGLNWTLRAPTNPTMVLSLQGVAFGNNLFVAVGFSHTAYKNAILYSSDGINWYEIVSLDTGHSGSKWASVCYGGGQFVAAAYTTDGFDTDGTHFVMTSDNGIDWAWQSTDQCYVIAAALAYGNNTYVGVGWGSGNSIMTSPDGENWSPSNSTLYNSYTWWDIHFANSRFYASVYGAGSNIISSFDGITWENASDDSPVLTYTIASSPNRIVSLKSYLSPPNIDTQSMILSTKDNNISNLFLLDGIGLKSSISDEYFPEGVNNFIGLAQINNYVLGLSPLTPRGIRSKYTNSDALQIESSEIGKYATSYDDEGISGYSSYASMSAGTNRNMDRTDFIAREVERHESLSAVIFSNREFESDRELMESPPYVCMYPPVSSIYTKYIEETYRSELSKEGETRLLNEFSPKCLLSGVNFNYLSEISTDNEPMFDHYEISGDLMLTQNPEITSNNLNLKNMYDYKYDVAAQISAEIVSYNDDNVDIDFDQINRSVGEILSGCISFARSYQKINVSNYNTVWLSYKCDKYYESKTKVSKKTNRSIPNPDNIHELSGVVYYEYDETTISDKLSIIYPVKDVFNSTVANSPLSQYEFIERIHGWNRFSLQPRHKSNYYSIMLKNTGFNKNLESLDESIQTKLQNSINNIIRKMVNKLLPVHTQLLNIYWSGD